MKKIMILLWLLSGWLFCNVKAGAQENKQESIPAFAITLTDSSTYNNNSLPVNKPLVLVYFSPACDHCKAFTKQLKANMKSFKNTEIVMISYQPLAEVKPFEKDFKLEQYNNLKVGTEGYTFAILKHYNIETFPFVALFDKSGKLIKTIREEPVVKDILAAFKQNR